MDLHLQFHIRLLGMHSDDCTLTFMSVPSTYITHPITFCSITLFMFSGECNLLRTWYFPTKIHYTLLVLSIRHLSQLMPHWTADTHFSVRLRVPLSPFLSLFLSLFLPSFFSFPLAHTSVSILHKQISILIIIVIFQFSWNYFLASMFVVCCLTTGATT
jgi:hypothetical protein